MKKLYTLLLLSGLLCLPGKAINNTPEQENNAVIYFFRLPAYAGSAAKMTIMSNDQPIVRLRNASYYRYTAAPGNYVFSFSFGSGSRVSLTAEAGREYYIKCYYNMGFWSGIPILEPLDSQSGKMMLEGNRLTEQASEPISVEPRNSRFGMLLSGGFGFEKNDLFVDENNDDVTLSPGGGFGIGLEYGGRIGKNFDLSLAAMFQGSTLSRSLKNASASFDRIAITLTPSLVIPVKSDMISFRLGAGPGIFALGTMKIDASEIGESKYTFKYKAAAGLNAQAMFDIRFMERGLMSMGIRYTGVHYKFTTEGSSHMAATPNFLEPNGSGIDLVMGYNFIF